MIRLCTSVLGLLFLLVYIPRESEACHAMFDREVKYLKDYLGLVYTNRGELYSKDRSLKKKYIRDSQQLNCNFTADCLWWNSETDSLLDTSNFWLFYKADDRTWPGQIQPGDAHPPIGSHYAIAGNITRDPMSAVLISAPVACQKGEGFLGFNYWLYNYAQVQVIIVKTSKRRKNLQVITKPQMDCNFYRQPGDRCVVSIPPIDEPFRIGIRAFNLKDRVLGSMAMINRITYHGNVCSKSVIPSVFFSSPLLVNETKSAQRITDLSQMNCRNASQECRWAPADPKNPWRIGTEPYKWTDLLKVRGGGERPDHNFLFLLVDGLAEKPYGKLISDLIPCTQKPTTLSFKYWMRLGTQVEVCSIDESGVPLSCAFLNDDDSPGPINVDVDPYSKPFRFSFEVINVDQSGGVIVLSDIVVSGVLCSQDAPLTVTTINPSTIASKFALTPRPPFVGVYSLSLECDFTADPCYQWTEDNGKMLIGVAPEDSEEFPFPEEMIRGNIGVFVLKGVDTAQLKSRLVPCAYNTYITITYARSEYAFIRVCALDKCADGARENGKITIPASSVTPFEISIEMRSRANAIVVIGGIEVEGDICPLKTIEQSICDSIHCNFTEGDFCTYHNGNVTVGDQPFVISNEGATVTIGENATRAALASRRFELVSPVLLVISITQETFGSRVLVCPDAHSPIDACNELLGPRVLEPKAIRITFPLDTSVRSFAIVAFHDKALQFGSASFTVHSVDVRTSDDYQMCF